MYFPSSTAYKSGHSLTLLRSGESYFNACEKAIDNARSFIHFQTYIVDNDETGNRLTGALIRAARRGVRVYFLLDAYGGASFSREMTEKVRDAGILFRKFSPSFVTRDFQLSLRLHHKVLLADGILAIIGGMNVADRYHGKKGLREWLDFAVLMKGPECAHVLFILKKLWNKTFISRKEKARETVHPKKYTDNIRVRVVENNWYRNKIEILKGYRWAMKHSQKSIIIFASYFLPGRTERKILRNASKRGVDISIVLSAESDAPLFKSATNFLYDIILRRNIKLYEYMPSNMHAKVAVIDGLWCTVGSYNMNHLSDYGSVEMNVNVLNERFTGRMERILADIMRTDCRQVTLSEYMKRKTWLLRSYEWFSYQVIRLLMRIMFLLTGKRKKIF